MTCGTGCAIDEPSPKGNAAPKSECIECAHKFAILHQPLFANMHAEIEFASTKYMINKFLIAGFISKLTNFGNDLDKDGYVPCGSTKCFGVMRVPIDRFSTTELAEIEKKGPDSVESISAGIELLKEKAECVCNATKSSQRRTINDVIMISKSLLDLISYNCTVRNNLLMIMKHALWRR